MAGRREVGERCLAEALAEAGDLLGGETCRTRICGVSRSGVTRNPSSSMAFGNQDRELPMG